MKGVAKYAYNKLVEKTTKNLCWAVHFDDEINYWKNFPQVAEPLKN